MYTGPFRRLLLGSALLGVASLPVAAGSSPASADPVEPIKIALLSINDFDETIADPTTVQFAATIEKQRALYGENSTLVLSAGDMVSGDGTTQNPQSLHFVPTFDVLNALDVRAGAVGNHEFHNWYGALKTTIPAAADFPLLSANILKSNVPQFSAYEMFDVAGLKVAVIGATTRETPILDPRVLLCGLKFTDPVDAVNTTAANLKALPDPPDIIVALYHEGAQVPGLNNDRERVRTATSADVDVVFSAHTHETYKIDGPVPGDPSKTRPVIQSGQKGDAVSEVVLSVDPNTKEVLSYTMDNIPRLTDPKDTLKTTYPRAAEVDAIVQDALANPPGTTTQSVGLC